MAALREFNVVPFGIHSDLVSLAQRVLEGLGRQPFVSPNSLAGTKQLYMNVEEQGKLEALCSLWEKLSIVLSQVTVFCNKVVESLLQEMEQRGYTSVCATHSGMSPAVAEAHQQQVASGSSKMLITNVDSQQLTYVINFELPDSPDEYLRRVGQDPQYQQRVAISFISGDKDAELLQQLCKHQDIKDVFQGVFALKLPRIVLGVIKT